MDIRRLSLGPLGTNCYIIYHDTEALVVDPGGEADSVISFLRDKQIRPLAILLTHAHFDHIGAVESLRNAYDINVYIHSMEDEWLGNPNLNGSKLFMGSEIYTRKAEAYLEPGHLRIGGFSFEILHTPGHSPGSVSFVFHDHHTVVGGDVLFNRGIGRTDLPGGDMEQLGESIKNLLYNLPDTYKVLPGHGSETTIGDEMRHNPFFPLDR
ncbi:MBL fold metallo-hydrolase [Virgibacillus siamensis]|uniref:MBL fold metallo-hydrolase n=1 Tax=Virgibacillus siamensis TaxID=480071 RepID=A0ABN1G1V6_9BACI